MTSTDRPVLILGAGINGTALARELALNRVPVCVVDTGDLSSGTTAYSSRLIHGGLRYLEYGEFALVRESLEERTRLLRLAPHFVGPLEFFIPIRNRFGGLFAAARRFLGLESRPGDGKHKGRGLWAIRIGLKMYDRYAHDPNLPKSRAMRVGDEQAIAVDRDRFGWLASYYDAQIVFPERFVVALAQDAREIARQEGVAFELFTYHRTVRDGTRVSIEPVDNAGRSVRSFEPVAIINATGAWVDETLARLEIPESRLIGGTKGSHFVTFNLRLRELLNGRAIYTEAADGRPVFVLPFLKGTLVGTTDEKFEGAPESAVATRSELDYLVSAVNEVLPQAALTSGDIAMHYSGVRPLPFVGDKTPAGITRRHWLHEHMGGPLPCYSVIGGKLTTCRSLAEEATTTILARLGRTRVADSRERVLPGEEAEAILRQPSPSDAESLFGTAIPLAFVRRVIEHEWVQRLEDLVERRLMLLYHPRLSRRTLEKLAGLLVETGRIPADRGTAEVDQVVERLQMRYGKRVEQ